jgi:hypothetical protein
MSKNALVKANGGSRAVGAVIDRKAALAYFKAYGDEAMVGGNIVGDLLTFAKGEWQRGREKEEVEEGTRIIVHMHSVLDGWVRWQDQKTVEQIMGAKAEGFRLPERETLGHMDKSKWPTNDDGSPRDPWVRSNQFLCKEEESGDIMTFSTSSGGGVNAVKRLCGEYSEGAVEHDEMWPIVELQTSFYWHKDKKRGKIYTPEFEIVGWTKDNNFEVGAAKPAAKSKAKKRASVRA